MKFWSHEAGEVSMKAMELRVGQAGCYFYAVCGYIVHMYGGQYTCAACAQATHLPSLSQRELRSAHFCF